MGDIRSRSGSKWRRTSAAALAAFFSVAATCGDSGSPTAPEDELGQFSASIDDGSMNQQLSGTAESMGTASGTPAWALELLATGGSGRITFTEEGMPRPGTGTYVIDSTLEHGGNAPNSRFTAVVLLPPSSGFGSISGTLEITSSSPTRVAGTFTFTAADPENESRTVTVTGSFDAVNEDF